VTRQPTFSPHEIPILSSPLDPSPLNHRLDRLTDYPFQRLTALLGGAVTPDSIVMSIGEPQHAPPLLVARILAEQAAAWGKYPPGNGTADFRAASADWLGRRFGLPAGLVDPDRHILPVAGTREALYLFAQAVCNPGDLVAMPNPFYQVYYGAAILAGGEPLLVPATAETGFQPDFESLGEDVLSRLALAYVCTPANPQGSVASSERLDRLVALARKHNFVLAVDECYSEIHDGIPPDSALAACARADRALIGGGQGLRNVVVFNSLSKRSSVPGLRSGFVCGDADLIAAFARLRSYGGAATPLPVLAAAAALWRDEAHVEESRALYRAKFDVAERLLGGRFGFTRPQGGFFLWLNVGDGESAALALWQKAKLRVLPGAYLAQNDASGHNPGQPYIRVALVQDLPTTERALSLLAQTL